MKKVLFHTLGCKLNQAETSQIAELWRRAGIAEPVGMEPAAPDIVFINGCAVTDKAAAKTRHAAARLAREHPQAVVIVGGCAGQSQPEDFSSIAGVAKVIGVKERFYVDWIREIKDLENLPITIEGGGDDFLPAERGRRSRAILKIQDGCDQRCAYCIIPSLRGGCRSLPRERALSAAAGLLADGAQEVVLTGVRIGAWGVDLPGKPLLSELVLELADMPGMGRLRLGSLEPWELNERIIRLVCEHPRVCGHLHIPLQHTHPEVIRRMGRPPLEDALNQMERLKVRENNLGLGGDILVGFPGETDEEFACLIEDLKRLPFTYLHVFRFSPRPGTTASVMSGRVDENAMKRRSRIVLEIAAEKRREFARRQLGRTHPSVPDRPVSTRDWVLAVADNYAKIRIPASGVIPGKVTPVTVIRFNGKYLTGEIA